MKEKIIALILMFILMALLPFAAAKCSDNNTSTNTMSTADTPKKPSETKDYGKTLCALLAAKYDESYNSETLKALAIILNTNYKVNPNSFSDDDYLPQDKASGSMKEIYPMIRKAADYAKEKTLCINHKAFYVPFSSVSNGSTVQSGDYSYLQPIASTWDCYSSDFSEEAKCVGVSINGVNYLCKNGSSAENALLWYLPGFEIE